MCAGIRDVAWVRALRGTCLPRIAGLGRSPRDEDSGREWSALSPGSQKGGGGVGRRNTINHNHASVEKEEAERRQWRSGETALNPVPKSVPAQTGIRRACGAGGGARGRVVSAPCCRPRSAGTRRPRRPKRSKQMEPVSAQRFMASAACFSCCCLGFLC